MTRLELGPSTFVRRALEDDPRFAVGHRARVAPALSAGTRLSVSCGLTLPHGWSRTDTVAGWKATPTALAKDVPAVFGFLA